MAELESFAFGDSPELADELLGVILIGKKNRNLLGGERGRQRRRRRQALDRKGRARATERGPRDDRGHAAAVGEVDAAFAHDEGEGDRTLADWREAHTDYFTRRSEFSPDMELYCERFRLVEVLKRE